MIRPALPLFFFWLSVQSFGQAPADSAQAANILTTAITCAEKGRVDSANLLSNRVYDYYKNQNNWVLWMRSHVKMAYSWALGRKQPFTGLELIEDAIRHPYRPPASNAEWEQLSLTYQAKAFVYEECTGDYISAKREYEQAFQIFLKQLNEKSDRIAGYLYYKYANLCTRLGDFEQARNLHQRSIVYSQLHNLPDIPKYGDLATVLLELGQNKEALSVVSAGLKAGSDQAEGQITLRRSEAQAYLNLGNLAEAQSSLAKIPALIARLKPQGSQTDGAYYWSGYYETQSAIDLKQGKIAPAVAKLGQAIKYETQTWGTSHRREVGKLYNERALIYLDQKKPLDALAGFQTALQCVLPGFKPKSPYENPKGDSLFAENTILEALEGKARALVALSSLEKALECYELIPLVEAKLRATHAYESSSLLALDESRHRFDAAIAIAWNLYENNRHDLSYAQRAFRLTEQSRGMLLLQSLAEAQAKYRLPEEVRLKEEQLHGKIAWYEHERAGEREAGKNADKQRLAQLEKDLFDLKQEQEIFRRDLRARYPDYASLSDEIRFLEAGDVASLLRSNQAMLDFYLTDSDAFVFAFDAQGAFHWHKVALPLLFRESVHHWVEYLETGNEEDKAGEREFRRVAHELYALLVEPSLQEVLPQSGSLMIIPDDALVFVPFEVLLRTETPEGNWRDLPWLLRDYSTGYGYSATLLQMQQQIGAKHREQHHAARYPFGGFAPTYSASAGVYQLTSTTDLVKSAQKLLDGKTWCGKDASEENFKTFGPDCRVLLLAMHGLADAENPERSRLLFGDPGPDAGENNNVLYASELQIMQLQADLAILSACHSGFGKLQKGEGVYSLARAFARAGVPATVMSLWLLHENTAAPLIEGFLGYLRAGKPKDEALQLAKLDFLKNNKNFALTHPFYWASVTTSGDMCPLSLQEPQQFRWWWILGICCFAGILWALRQRMKRKLSA